MAAQWVDLSKELPGASASPARTTPVPFGGESDYMRMLREAQSETSARTSARVSPIASAFVSQASTRAPPSPKSPPNSPNLEFSDCEDIHASFYVNRPATPPREDVSAFLWDWSCGSPCLASPCSLPPPRPLKPRAEGRGWGLRAVAGVLLSNLVSLLLGAGIGVWIYRRSSRTIEVMI